MTKQKDWKEALHAFYREDGYSTGSEEIEEFISSLLQQKDKEIEQKIAEKIAPKYKPMVKKAYSLMQHKDITKSENLWREGYNQALRDITALLTTDTKEEIHG